MDNTNRWISVSMTDGMIFEGTVVSEAPYGLYMLIGGQEGRLSLFPWHQVARISFRGE